MSLSKPSARKHIHTRDISCKGYLRDDGLWDIEGQLIDSKTYSFDNVDRGMISAGEPIHHMKIRLTVNDELEVIDAEASTIEGPFTICDKINAAYKSIIGLRIGPGWRKSVIAKLGRTKGCTHLTDLLLGTMPVVAFQTIREARRKRHGELNKGSKPAIIDTCYALASDSPVTKREWPDFYTGPSDS